MKNFLHGILLAAFLGLSGAPAHSAEVVERILAVVNDEIITEQDLNITMAPVAAQYRTLYIGQELDEKIRRAREEFLEKVIEDKLILSEAKKKQVLVKDEEVEEMLVDVRNKFPSREKFLEAIEEQGLTEKKLWDRFRDQLMTQKLVNYEVRSKVAVSPGEVNDYYKEHSEEFVQGDQVLLQHILVRTTTRPETEAQEIMQRATSEIEAGTPFEEVAKKYSEGAEAKEGGQMGWMEKGQLMGEIDATVFSLEPGKITPPLKSALGFHIFKVVEKKKFSVRPLADVRGQVQEIIYKEKLKTRLENWMKSLKKNAYISIR